MGTREQQRIVQRQRILIAAQRRFAELGSENVTMADVATEAKVSRATVFNHYGSKRALLEGITESVLQTYCDLVQGALNDANASTPHVLRQLFTTMAAGIESQRNFHRGVFREIGKLTLGLDEGGPGQRLRQQSIASMVELLERGQKRGDIDRSHSAEDLARGFDSLLFGVVTHWLYDDASEALNTRMQRAIEIFLRPVEKIGHGEDTAAV